MRILFIFHTPWIQGGASKSGITLVKGLREKGHRIVAVCPEEGSLTEMLRRQGIEVKTFGYGWAYPYFERSMMGILKYIPKLALNYIRNRKALARMTEFASTFRPDIIHTNSGVADIGLSVARRLGLPHVSHFREFGWKDCNAVMLHEASMRSYPRQHGIAIGKEILKWHTKPGDDNTLIYNGIVRSGTSRQSTSKESYFLYVGGLFKEKGIEDLLQAYSMMDEDIMKSHQMKIAGSAVDTKYMKHLQQLCDRLGITKYVEWLGERSDVNELMSKANALIVPSHHEAFGRIVVEGMSNGCVVIGRNSAGIKEQLDNGASITGDEIGLRYETVGQLADRMRQVVSQDPSSFEPMINRSQQTVERLYTTDAYVNNVIGLYEKIIVKRQ